MAFGFVTRFTKMCCSVISSTFVNKEGMVKIEKVDDIKKKIIFRIRGVNAPIHLDYDEIIKDADILNGLSPMQASYVGYYYGLYYYNFIAKSNYPNIYFDCFINTPLNKHTIYMIDRKGNILYVDQTSKKQYSMSPLQIMLDKNLIVKFTPLQSCYIGILSGISKAKINNQISKLRASDQKLTLAK